MEIVKAFTENNLNIQINIQGTYDKPLFRASDVGEVLEIANIRSTIKDYDDSQKVVVLTDTLGGEQAVTFLTEFGLYEVLGSSRKKIAKNFRKWVWEVIREIRLTGQYKYEKQLEDAQKTIQEKETEVQNVKEELEIKISENERRVIDYFPKIVYAGYCDDDMKFGYTNNVERRLRDHKSTFGPQFTFEIVIPSVYNIEIEK